MVVKKQVDKQVNGRIRAKVDLAKPHSLLELSPLPGSRKNRTRVGRGHAAGKGKQAGRGQSGQKKRSKVRVGFEGGQNPWYRRLPKRGFKSLSRVKTTAIPLQKLDRLFQAETIIDHELLIKSGCLKRGRAKIVSGGELTKALSIKGVAISKSAVAKVLDRGGEVS